MGQKRQMFLYAIAATFLALSLFMLATGDVLTGLMGLVFFGGCGVVCLAEPAGALGRKKAAARRAGDTTATCFGFNRLHMAVMALGGGLMAAGSGLIAALGGPIWVAWPATALGLVCALALGWRAADKRPVVIIDADGLFDRRILRTPLRWEDIQALSLDGPFGLSFVTVHPVEGSSLSTRKRQLRIGHEQLDGSLADMLAAIHRFRPQVIIMAPED